MEKLNVVVLAAGQSTRLQQIHNDLYPKILCNVGQETVLDNIRRTFTAVANRLDRELMLHIVVNSSLHEEQITQYLSVINGNTDGVKLYVYYDSANNVDALQRLFASLPQSYVLTWSDIWLTDNVINQFTESLKTYMYWQQNVIFTESNSKAHRYNYEDDARNRRTLTKELGNVCGLYYIANSKILLNTEHTEITELLAECDAEHSSVNIVDIGDLKKYESYLSNVDIKTRYFNKLDVEGNIVRKTAITRKGCDVMTYEVGFYTWLKDKNFEHFKMPKLLWRNENGTDFKMSKIENAVELKNFELTEDADLKTIFRRIVVSLNELHSSGSFDNIKASRNAAMIEYVYVALHRNASISALLPQIHYVNDVDVQGAESALLRKAEQIAKECTRLVPIHGDPNSSNIMISGGYPVFIDPRGIFGDVSVYGDAAYDYAKVLYGMYGYDKFNDTKDFRLSYRHNSISIDPELIPDVDAIIDAIKDNNLPEHTKSLIALIWYKLSAYTINNINKAIAAKAIALYVYTELHAHNI